MRKEPKRRTHVTDSDPESLRSARGVALALATGLLAALPAAAPAATLGVVRDEGRTYVRYLAAPGETNRLEVREAASGAIAFVDPGATIDPAGPSCTEVSAHEARCLSSATAALGISLGDLHDRATIDVAKPALIGGGGGKRHADRTCDALLQVLHEREPDLRDHVGDVAELALRVGVRLGLKSEALDDVRRAGELHDVGKSAKALSHREAPTELRRCSGTQFDPTVVRALCAEVAAPRSGVGARAVLA